MLLVGFVALATGCGGDATLPVEPPPVQPPPTSPNAPFVGTISIFSRDGRNAATLLPGESIELFAYAEDEWEVIDASFEWSYEIVDGSLDGGVSIESTLEGVRVTAISPTSIFIKALPKANVISAPGPGVFGLNVRVPRSPFIWSPDAGMRRIPTPSNSEGEALAINNAGEVVGWYAVDRTSKHAFIWSDKDGFRDINPAVLGSNSSARAINDGGMVAGMMDSPNNNGYSFVWKAGQWDAIGLGSGVSSRMTGAFGINDAGDVVGEGHVGVGLKPVVWTQQRVLVALPVDGMLSISRPTDINNSGRIVGYAASRSGPLPGSVVGPAPVVWSTSNATAKPLTPPRFDGCGTGWHPQFAFGNQCSAIAVAINDSNQTAGTIGMRAFRTSLSGDQMIFPDAIAASAATAINNAGDVAGNLAVASIESRNSFSTAFIWSATGVVRKLGTLSGMTSSYANGINDRGQVVGYVE